MKYRPEVDISKNCFCLTINENRYDYMSKVFKHYDLPVPTKFQGLSKEPNPVESCLLGHMCLIMMARALDFPYIVVFEDDAYPRKDILSKLDHYLKVVPADCGILCLGQNGQRGLVEKKEDLKIIKERPYGSHAYICFRECYDEFLNSLEKQRIVDIALKGNNYYRYKPYWTNEVLFVQKNIDGNNMDPNSNKGKYFYPHEITMDLFASNTPPEGFEDKIDGIYEPLIIFVNHPSWRGNCYLDLDKNILIHGDHKSIIEKIEDNVWRINWEKFPGANEYLVQEGDSYKIVINYKAKK